MPITFTNWWEAKEYARQQEELGNRTRVKQVGYQEYTVTIIGKGKPLAAPNRETRSGYEDIKEVANGTKPAALVWGRKSKQFAESLGLRVLPSEKRSDILVVRKGEEEKANKIIQIFKKYPLPERENNPEYHRELGRALGYSEEEISFWNRSSGLE